MSITYRKRLLTIGWDAFAWCAALGFFLLTRFGLDLSTHLWWATLGYTATAIPLQIALGLRFHLYLGRSRLGSFDEMVLLANIVLSTGLAVGALFLLTQHVFSRGAAIVIPTLALLIMAAGRTAFRSTTTSNGRRHTDESIPKALVYGAGDAGHQVAHLIAIADEPPYAIAGFIDDDPGKRFLRIGGRRVLGRGKDLVEVADTSGAEVVILAISLATPQFLADLSQRCTDAGLKLVVVPPVREMIGGRVELAQLREPNVADLLGRRPVESDLSEIAHYVTGKVVLVTGAGGSIGSELARQVHALRPASLVLLDRDESMLHATQLTLTGSGRMEADEIVLCNIREREPLAAIFERHRPDVVFHAAALKHLPMLERFPREGWRTNVLGSLNVLHCASTYGVQHFVNVSTDKAADPTSVLGRTKRIAERLTAWYAAETGLPYLSVRFGNVLGSRGSVLDTFRAQLERGGPLTVTDPEVTRYFMTIPEACQLVLQAGAIGDAGDALVLDMGEPVKIVDMARRLIQESGRDIDIDFTGLRESEKLHEVLLSVAEEPVPSSHPLITQVEVPPLDPETLLNDKDAIHHMKDLMTGGQVETRNGLPTGLSNGVPQTASMVKSQD